MASCSFQSFQIQVLAHSEVLKVETPYAGASWCAVFSFPLQLFTPSAYFFAKVVN